jgi:hypothetical protein
MGALLFPRQVLANGLARAMNKAEKLVYEDLVARGFFVSLPRKSASINGVDLIAMKNGEAFRIEVKKVVVGKKCKTVKPVMRSGRSCDWIALVLPKDIVYQPMEDHLRCCGKTGTRGITALAKLREMLIAGIETGDTL